MRDRDWPGLAAFILAVGLGVGWAVSLIILATPWTNQINQAESDLLNGIGQVLAGALATFLGVSSQRRANKQDKADQ